MFFNPRNHRHAASPTHVIYIRPPLENPSARNSSFLSLHLDPPSSSLTLVSNLILTSRRDSDLWVWDGGELEIGQGKLLHGISSKWEIRFGHLQPLLNRDHSRLLIFSSDDFIVEEKRLERNLTVCFFFKSCLQVTKACRLFTNFTMKKYQTDVHSEISTISVFSLKRCFLQIVF